MVLMVVQVEVEAVFPQQLMVVLAHLVKELRVVTEVFPTHPPAFMVQVVAVVELVKMVVMVKKVSIFLEVLGTEEMVLV
jgi:hypothetical protein